MENLTNKNGTALVLALLVMLVLTIFSLVAANKTSQGLRYTGGHKIQTATLFLADGGADYSYGLIERAVANDLQLDPADSEGANVTVDTTDSNYDGITDLEDEIMARSVNNSDSYSDSPPNVKVAITNSIVNIDIDFIKSRQMPGASSEFASRYEGIGSGTSGAVGLYYRVDSNRQLTSNMGSTIRINYKCIEGGGRCL